MDDTLADCVSSMITYIELPTVLDVWNLPHRDFVDF